MSDQMTPREINATCEACTLAETMKDCPRCQFDAGEYPKATTKDFFDMYRRLWGERTPQDFDVFRMCDPCIGVLDDTQVKDADFDCPHEAGTVYKWKTYPATREEPSETVGRLYCDECGEEFELGYEPEGMELRWIEGAEYLED